MAQRYELQVNERSTPAAFARAYPVNAEQAGINLAKMGDAQAEWAVYAQKRQAEWDAATVMNAQNEFQKQMHEYLYNPEAGQMNVRKLGAARGLTDEADEQADKIIQEISGRLENNNQKNAFKNIAERLKMPFWEQASRHEAREFEQYKEQAFKANIAANSDMALSVPYSESTGINTNERALAHEQVENAIRSRMFGASEEAINQAVSEAQSDIDEKITAVIAQDNPIWALKLLGDKKSGLKLSNEARADLTARIKPRAEIYEIQGIADELIKVFPSGSETEALNFIRQKFSGEKEERIASAYKMRVGESEISEHKAELELKKAQKDNFNKIVSEGYISDGGRLYSEEELKLMAINQEIAFEDISKILNMNAVYLTRTAITKRLSKSAGWGALTPEQQEERVMNEMARHSGITDEQRHEVLDRIVSGVINGTVTDSDLNTYYANGIITASERERAKKFGKQFNAEQKEFIALTERELLVLMDELNLADGKLSTQTNTQYKQLAKATFANIITERGINKETASGTFRHDVVQAQEDTLLRIVESTGNINNDDKITKWYNDTIENYIKRLATDFEYRPVFQTDDVTINPRANNSGGLLWHSVIDARNITSRKGLRNEKNHNGIDIGAAGGSAVRVPPISGLKVKKTVTGSYKGDTKHPEGNAVFLEGKLPNGDNIEVRMFHLQEDSITVKSGDIVDAGSVIAKVGNTGHVRGKNGGYHLHLEVLVNDQHVDPEKYLMPGAPNNKKSRRRGRRKIQYQGRSFGRVSSGALSEFEGNIDNGVFDSYFQLDTGNRQETRAGAF